MFGSRFKDINFKGDIFGGVTTAIISLPLALAFGVASGRAQKLAFGAPSWWACLPPCLVAQIHLSQSPRVR